MAPTLHQSLLMVTDLDASITFYQDIIGLETTQVKDSNVEFDTGEATLVLEEDFDKDVLDAFGLTEPVEPRGEGVIVAIDVGRPDVVDDVCKRADEAGYTIRMDPKDVPWGRHMSILSDPDGYLVEISAAV